MKLAATRASIARISLVITMSCMVWLAALPAHAESASDSIVVWRLGAKKGVDASEIELISGYLTTQVERVTKAQVVSEADIASILKGEETKQKCGSSSDTGCLAEVGNALGARETISGDLGRVGSYWILNLRRIDVRSVTVLKRVSRRVSGSIDRLMEAIPSASAELFDEESASYAAPPVAASTAHGEAAEAPKPNKDEIIELENTILQAKKDRKKYLAAGHGIFWSGMIVGGALAGTFTYLGVKYPTYAAAGWIYAALGYGGVVTALIAGPIFWSKAAKEKDRIEDAEARLKVISLAPTPDGKGAAAFVMIQF